MNNPITGFFGIILVIALLWRFGPVHGAELEPLDEHAKSALIEAYHLNGDSMVRYGSIDMTGWQPAAVRVIPITPPIASNIAVAPTIAADEPDTCTRHHMHRVLTHHGKSWRCQE